MSAMNKATIPGVLNLPPQHSKNGIFRQIQSSCKIIFLGKYKFNIKFDVKIIYKIKQNIQKNV